MILEICASSVQSAINAQEGGADRVELCTDLEMDGLTPTREMILETRQLIQIPIHVLVRPKAGDFVYSSTEMETMIRDIEFCKEAGCQGVVIGVLHEDNTVDIGSMTMLIQAADGLDVTFHRAFDQVPDPIATAKALSFMGVNRILTSGQASNAIEGVGVLTQLIKEAGNDIKIMPGGGIRPENIKQLIETDAEEFHSSAREINDDHSNLEMIRQMKKFFS